jgi:hypothetical protein
MNNYQENLNKKIEETRKNFEKMFSCPVSYHEEKGWNGKNGIFTIKLGNYDEKKVKKPVDELEKVLGNSQPVNFQIENSDGKLIKASKEKFVNYWIEERKNDEVVKESYYEQRSEEEKKQIIERNKKRLEQEKSQAENSSIQYKKNQPAEKKKKKIILLLTKKVHYKIITKIFIME